MDKHGHKNQSLKNYATEYDMMIHVYTPNTHT